MDDLDVVDYDYYADAEPLTASVGTDATGTASQEELGWGIVQETLGAQIVADSQQEFFGQSIVNDALQTFRAAAAVPWGSFLPASGVYPARPSTVGASVASGISRPRPVASVTGTLSTGELFGLVALLLVGGFAVYKLS